MRPIGPKHGVFQPSFPAKSRSALKIDLTGKLYQSHRPYLPISFVHKSTTGAPENHESLPEQEPRGRAAAIEVEQNYGQSAPVDCFQVLLLEFYSVE